MKPSGKKIQAFSKRMFSRILRILETYFSYPSEQTIFGIISVYIQQRKLTLESNTWTLVPTTVVSLCPFLHGPPHQKPHQEQFVFSCLMQISLWWSVSFASLYASANPFPGQRACTVAQKENSPPDFMFYRRKKTA